MDPQSPGNADEMAGPRGCFEAIPLVDLAGLWSELPADRQVVAEALGRAARTAGFLYVSNHGVAEASLRGLREQAAAFFALPQAVKERYYIGRSRNHRGYVPPGEEVFYGQGKDSKEGFDLSLDLPADDPDYLAGNRLLGPNVWPDELPAFRVAVNLYYDEVMTLGRRLARGFALALGLAETQFDAQLTKPPSQLRLLHYPARQATAGDGMGIGSHTDYELFTILHSSSPGLEVLNGAGRWIDAPPVPAAFVVNIGDMLEVLSNGHWLSTAHRVRPVAEERYSFPLFFSLDYHTRVEPLPCFVRDQTRRYPSLLAGEHLLAQTAQSFGYFAKLIERGEFQLPSEALELASFGRDSVRDEGER
jgi:isopenicillin N synthase-like dioxygenase